MPRKTKSEKYIVYKHTNKINGKVYVGITSTDIVKRAGKNGNGYRKNVLFYRAIEKYGWDNFEHDVLLSNLTLNDAVDSEAYYINKYNSANPLFGYNISVGGESGNTGCRMSDEEREKRRARMSGINNPCYGRHGVNHPAYGRKHSIEERTAISASQTGVKRSIETRHRISDIRRSIEAWVGEDNPMSGKKYGDAPHSKMVICIETGEIFDSVKRAAEYVSCFPTSITAACVGRQKTCRGFHWRYVDKSEVTASAS